MRIFTFSEYTADPNAGVLYFTMKAESHTGFFQANMTSTDLKLSIEFVFVALAPAAHRALAHTKAISRDRRPFSRIAYLQLTA